MKETFSYDVRERLFSKYNYICANFKNTEKCLINKGLELHHIVHNTIVNRKLYGNDNVQSEENGMPLCKYCHDNQAQFAWIQAIEAQNKAKWSSPDP